MKKQSAIFTILKTYGLIISLFFVFRLILFFNEFSRIDFAEVGFGMILESFWMGVRFDLAITGYIMILPAFILLLLDVVKVKSKLLPKIIFWWIFVIFSVAFIIAAIDIPYFNQFFARLTISALQWLDNLSFVTGMISEEPIHFLFVIPLILIIIVFYKLLKRIFSKHELSNGKIAIKIPIYLIFLGLVFLGIRGRIEDKSPIKIGTAYFSNNAFLNQLGLNPVFTFFRTFLDNLDERNKTIHLMDEQKAIAMAQKNLGIATPEFDYSPIARIITPDSISDNQPNIVLIIMESMSASKMTRHGNTKNLTPFLDSLSNESIYFENVWSAGKHTYNGIFSTLNSFPALYHQHTMKTIRSFHGLTHELKDRGYSTTYFTTHDSEFDNVGGFLRGNAYERIVYQNDYPSEEVKTTLGVPDDFMFRFSKPILNNLSKDNKPFFATFMTCSDHTPHYIPDYFNGKNNAAKDEIVEYADWSLEQFIKQSKQEKWFDNTIFVFVADHGYPMTVSYDISLDYHHIPLLFYSPKYFPEAISYDKIGSQLDVFPTLMGLLNKAYINNTMGIDLIKNKRDFALINDDQKIGILSDSLLLIMNDDGNPRIHKYKTLDKVNYFNQYQNIAPIMEDFAKSNMQTFQYMLEHDQSLVFKSLEAK